MSLSNPEYMDDGDCDGFDIVPRQAPPQLSVPPRYHRQHMSWTAQEQQVIVNSYREGLTISTTSMMLSRPIAEVRRKFKEMRILQPVWFNGSEQWANASWNRPDTERQLMEVYGGIRPVQGSTQLGEKYVNMNHLITLMQKGYTTCEVQFYKDSHGVDTSPTIYTYKISDKIKDLGCDRCIVETDKGGYKLGWIAKIHDKPKIDVAAPYAYKWVVDVVREQDYIEQCAKEREAMAMIADGQRAKAQEEAMATLLQHVPDREALLKLLGN